MQPYIRDYLERRGITLVGELKRTKFHNSYVHIDDINFISIPGISMTRVPAIGKYAICFLLNGNQTDQAVNVFNFEESGSYAILAEEGIEENMLLNIISIKGEAEFALDLAKSSEEFEMASKIRKTIEEKNRRYQQNLQRSIDQLISDSEIEK